MRRLPLLVSVCWLFAGPVAIASAANDLRSFFVALQVSYGRDIVAVDPVGEDVRVRVIRVSSPNAHCHQLVVQAVERVIPKTTVQQVAGDRVCTVSKRRIEEAIHDAPFYGGTDSLGGVDTVVMDCGGRPKLAAFGIPRVDWELLRRQARDVHNVWNLGYRMRELVTERGEHDPFPEEPADRRAAREALGTQLLRELISGKFNAPFQGWTCTDRKTPHEVPCTPNYFAWILRDYAGPPSQRGPLPIELVERDSLKLAHYVAPVMPQIALSARVFGDVQLRITADPQTGHVTNVEPLVSANRALKLLEAAAVDAARAWRFAPGSVPTEPVVVTLRFQIRCPGEGP